MQLEAEFLSNPALGAVFALFAEAGHVALIVGGAVRNAVMGREITDIDLATDALPEKVMALAEGAGFKAIATGLDHGTVTVVAQGQAFEVTTFRRDVATDGRRAMVVFTDQIALDAARRDFTMNALYADATGQVLDPLGSGVADALAGRIRFVGDPAHRIAEDYLRILRFFRFHAHYGRPGAVDAAGLQACAEGRAGLAQISAERIGAETRRLLAASDPIEAVQLMAGAGVLQQILPGASNTYLAALIRAEAATGAPPEWRRRLGVLDAPRAADCLRLSRAETRHLKNLAEAKTMSPGAAAYHYGPELARDGVLLAIATGRPIPKNWPAEIASAKPLPIRAADLTPLEGPPLGTALRHAEALWIASGFRATAPELIAGALAKAAGTA